MTSRPLLATACLTVAAAIVTGCGAEVPSNSVAKVGGDTITKADFNKWLKTAAMGQSQGGAATVPDPPNFTNCVAQLQKQPAQKGVPKPTAAQAKTQCKQEFDRLKGEVMQFLIQAQWVQQEADQRDVSVSDAEVKKSFDDQKKQAFPTAKEYQQFLKTSGMNEQDILFRVRLDTLQNKLTKKITEDETKVTDQDVENYYNKNKKRFSQPERRDLLVVLTKTKSQAEAAKKQLEKGTKFATVAKKYSVDNTSKTHGGKLPDVTRGSQEKSFENSVFKAPKGKVEGPVKTQFGYYVYKVTAIKKPSQQSLDKAKDTIKNLLRSQRQQKALDGFIKQFRKDYKEKTACAKGYVVQECKNAPKQQKTGQQGAPQQGVPQGGQQGAPPSGTPQQVPQQGAPQQAPQGGAQQVPTPTPQPTDPAPQGPASP
jgi:foldase protein PrsA